MDKELGNDGTSQVWAVLGAPWVVDADKNDDMTWLEKLKGWVFDGRLVEVSRKCEWIGVIDIFPKIPYEWDEGKQLSARKEHWESGSSGAGAWMVMVAV